MKQKEFEYEYNPVKEQIGGKAVEAVIWTTKAIERARDAIKKGLPLKANPFIGKEVQLLKPDLVFSRTNEEIEMYKHAMNDVLYFASLCTLITPDGLKKITLRDYQEEYLKELQENPFTIFLSCRQSGKSTTTAIYCLWCVIFNVDYSGLVLSKSGPAGRDLITKIKDIYRNLPDFIKPGIYKWNISEMTFDNNSNIITEAFSPTAGLGKTINFLILDEFAWCPPSEVRLFYNNIIPTISTMPNAKIAIMSTQNGFNFFKELWDDAILGKSMYKTFKVDWWQVPELNKKTGIWEKRDEKWKNKMIGLLKGEDNFYYQYGTLFCATEKSLLPKNTLEELQMTKETWVKWDLDDTVIDYGEYLEKKSDFLYNKDEDFLVVLIDIAEGGGNDYTVFQILKYLGDDKFEHVARWDANIVDIEGAAKTLFQLFCFVFNKEHTIVSVEWNTYGALFYKWVLDFDEKLPQYDFETSVFVTYTKIDEDLSLNSSSKKVPGLKMTANSKKSGCLLIKNDFIKHNVFTTDLKTILEWEKFELKGNGTYSASSGHDDKVMPFVQLPKLKESAKYREFKEDYNQINNVQLQEQNMTYNTGDIYSMIRGDIINNL